METSHQTILDLAAQRGLIRPRDLDALGLPSVALTRLVRQGLLVRVGRGLYARPDRSVSEHGTLAEVARTTESPFEVWLAMPNKARAPKMDYPPLRIVRFSGPSLTDGIEEHQIDGVTVRVTNIARTVADFQVPQQDRPRSGDGSAAGSPACQTREHGRTLALCHAVPGG